MTQINRTVLVEYTAKSMFELVLDVDAYPEFLPWCSGARVEQQSAQQQIAMVRIAKGPLNTDFTTCNALLTDRQISIELVDGPFSQLEGSWRFQPLGESACKVELNMQFDFAPGPVGLLLKPVFSHICSTLLDAFVERAKALSQIS